MKQCMLIIANILYMMPTLVTAAAPISLHVGLGHSHFAGSPPDLDTSVLKSGQRINQDSDLIYQISADMPVTDNLFITASYLNFGEFIQTFAIRDDIAFIAEPADTLEIKADGYTIGASLHYPLTSNLVASISAGASLTKLQQRWVGGFDPQGLGLPPFRSKDEINSYWGAALQFKNNDTVTMSLGIQRYTVSDIDINIPMLTMSFGY